jgi:short-subunit dehydrogenase
MTRGILHDKIAIVTGASSGIGRATALELAKSGAHLVLASRQKKSLEELAKEIEGLGRDALVEPTDITQRHQVDTLISKVVSHYGRIDILIACAGVYYRSPIKDMSLSIIDRSMAVNFYGGLYSIMAALPYMCEQNSGHIVLVSTMDTKLGFPGDAPYAAAKAALSVFVDVLHQELHGSEVYTTIIFPGRVDTPFIDDLKLPRISMTISPQVVARSIVKAIEKRKPNVMLPFIGVILCYIKIFFPSLANWIVRSFRLQGWEMGDISTQTSKDPFEKEQIRE